jgi:hypothetical protein
MMTEKKESLDAERFEDRVLELEKENAQLKAENLRLQGERRRDKNRITTSELFVPEPKFVKRPFTPVTTAAGGRAKTSRLIQTHNLDLEAREERTKHEIIERVRAARRAKKIEESK